MPVLYLTEPGATLRLKGESLIVTIEDESGSRKTLAEVEPHRLELVALLGGTHATREALDHCVEHGIGVAWFTGTGRFRARVVPEQARNADLRLRQYAAATDFVARLSCAAEVVQAKLENAASVLVTYQSNHPGVAEVSEAIREVRARAQDAATPRDVDHLLGVEGAGARAYFEALRVTFRGEIPFTGRAQRPPPDPANALLSFGYTLLGNLIAGRLEARGLDPAIGFFHELRSGRPSLALDLLEELRHPVVDRFVMRIANLRQMGLRHFETDAREGGVRMTREGLRIFFPAWEDHLKQTLRDADREELSPLRLVDRQIERLAADLRGGTRYRAFRLQS